MKKGIIVLAVLLTLLSLVGCGNSETPQTSESIDLTKLSDEEIVSLNKSIQEEIVARNIEKSAVLQPGQYTIGRDIPAGTYNFSAKYESETSYIFVEVYADGGKGERLFYQHVFHDDGEVNWTLTLNEGELLKFTDGEITMTVSAGIQFR